MSVTETNDNVEARILKAAKSLFIEKGFAETSMSDIAARAGINRPALHYYFRTKEKMFHAVFGEIILSIVPKVFGILLQKDKPLEGRVGEVVDAYYRLFLENPKLPMFVIREMNRDVALLVETAARLRLPERLGEVMDSLREEMAGGGLRPVPPHFLFYNLYGLLVVPFLTRDLVASVVLREGESFEEMLDQWKPCVVAQMAALLRRPLPAAP